MKFCLLAMHLALAITAASLPSQEKLVAGSPAQVGMSEAVLQAAAGLFENAVAADDLKGVVLLVARKGRIVLHEAYGFRDPDRKKPMLKDSLFRMASNTKPTIAVAVLQLVEQGKLGLEQGVRKHLPSFDNHRAAWITTRHLLSHTGGLRIRPIFLRPLIGKSDEHPDAPSLGVEVARFGEIGAEVAPGTSYAYSNAGYNTLGALIEVASGMPLKKYLKAKIYEPLGMVDSCNHESDADNARMSAIFRKSRRSPDWRIGWKPGNPPDYPFPRASGGMISSAHDYAIFCQMWLNGGTYGGKRILGEKWIAEATKPQTRYVYSAEQLRTRRTFYGFGWSVSTAGIHSHGGSDGTFAWVDPRRKIIGIVFTQSPGGKNPREQFMRIVDAACLGAR